MIDRLRNLGAGKKRRAAALAAAALGFSLLALALLFLGGEEKGMPGGRKPGGSIKIMRGVDLAREKWRVEGEKRLAALEAQQRETARRLDAVSRALESPADGPAPSSGLPPPADGPPEADSGTGAPSVFPGPVLYGSPEPSEPPRKPEHIRVFSPAGGAPAPGSARPAALVNWIPSGSFVPGVLVSGLDAPASTSSSRNPHPVLIHLAGAARMPNFRRMNVARCHVTGAAYGQLSSERAYVRLERIACVLRSGDVVDSKIKGYAAGEDGKTGIRGRLVSKQGRILSRGILAGFASGFGSAAESARPSAGIVSGGTLATVSRGSSLDMAKAGLGGGTGEAGRLLAEYYLKLAEEVFPVIEIDAGRRVDVVITEGTELLPKKTAWAAKEER